MPKRPTSLERQLGAIFAPSKPKRRSDPYRQAREEAKKLAAEHNIEIERFPEGGFNVWPPKGVPDEIDPFEGDHYAGGWDEVLTMVRQYVSLAEQGQE
jgi:hypothetical protein